MCGRQDPAQLGWPWRKLAIDATLEIQALSVRPEQAGQSQREAQTGKICALHPKDDVFLFCSTSPEREPGEYLGRSSWRER